MPQDVRPVATFRVAPVPPPPDGRVCTGPAFRFIVMLPMRVVPRRAAERTHRIVADGRASPSPGGPGEHLLKERGDDLQRRTHN